MIHVAICESSCGVLAVGRCFSCNRAFCATHQAYTGFGSPLAGMCIACSLTPKVPTVKIIKNLYYGKEHQQYLRNRIKRIAKELAEANIPMVRRHKWKEERKKFFGGYKQIFEEIESAWSVGTCSWQYGYDSHISAPTGVTEQGEIVVMYEENSMIYNSIKYGIDNEEKNQGLSRGTFEGCGKDLDSIETALQKLASKHGLQLEPYQWPPVKEKEG